jgi:3',5'-cyclic AMP phosphodiesterase CpdA
MELLQIKRTEFNLGLKKEYKFFQISDMHISYFDKFSSQSDVDEHSRCEANWYKLKKEFADNHNEFCDDRYNVESTSLCEKLFDHAKQFGANAIILSGDMMDRVTDSNIRYLKNLISKIDIPVIYCLGNHDYTAADGNHACHYEKLSELTQSPECISYDYGDFELLIVDNNKDISENQLNFLKEKIASDKKLLLVEHKPLLLGEFGDKLLSKIGTSSGIGGTKIASSILHPLGPIQF